MARIARAHAATTRAAKPRPRNGAAVSSPAAAAVSERRAQKQMLTGQPSSAIAITGARPAAISPDSQPPKWRSRTCSSSMEATSGLGSNTSGKMNAGPLKPRCPPVSETYCAAWKGAVRRSPIGRSPPARRAISSAASSGTSPRTAQTHAVELLMMVNSGPRLAMGSRVDRMRPRSSVTKAVVSSASGVIGSRLPICRCHPACTHSDRDPTSD